MIQINPWPNYFIKLLFQAQFEFLEQQIEDLTNKNNSIVHVDAMGFIYGGKPFFTQLGTVLQSTYTLPCLAKSLYETGYRIAIKEQEIIKDKNKIEQLLIKLIGYCSNQSEIRSALPDCLVNLEPRLKSIERNFEPAFTLKDNPNDLQMYERLLPLIKEYAILRLVT